MKLKKCLKCDEIFFEEDKVCPTCHSNTSTDFKFSKKQKEQVLKGLQIADIDPSEISMGGWD